MANSFDFDEMFYTIITPSISRSSSLISVVSDDDLFYTPCGSICDESEFDGLVRTVSLEYLNLMNNGYQASTPRRNIRKSYHGSILDLANIGISAVKPTGFMYHLSRLRMDGKTVCRVLDLDIPDKEVTVETQIKSDQAEGPIYKSKQTGKPVRKLFQPVEGFEQKRNEEDEQDDDDDDETEIGKMNAELLRLLISQKVKAYSRANLRIRF